MKNTSKGADDSLLTSLFLAFGEVYLRRVVTVLQLEGHRFFGMTRNDVRSLSDFLVRVDDAEALGGRNTNTMEALDGRNINSTVIAVERNINRAEALGWARYKFGSNRWSSAI